MPDCRTHHRPPTLPQLFRNPPHHGSGRTALVHRQGVPSGHGQGEGQRGERTPEQFPPQHSREERCRSPQTGGTVRAREPADPCGPSGVHALLRTSRKARCLPRSLPPRPPQGGPAPQQGPQEPRSPTARAVASHSGPAPARFQGVHPARRHHQPRLAPWQTRRHRLSGLLVSP